MIECDENEMIIECECSLNCVPVSSELCSICHRLCFGDWMRIYECIGHLKIHVKKAHFAETLQTIPLNYSNTFQKPSLGPVDF